MNFALWMMLERSSCCFRPSVGRGCDRRKDHRFRPNMGRGCDHRKDHEISLVKTLRLVRLWSKSDHRWYASPRDFSLKSMITACWLSCCIINNWLIIMILFVIMFMFVVSLQVHSMYWPGMPCQISGKPCCKECCPSLDRVHIGVPVLWVSLRRCSATA